MRLPSWPWLLTGPPVNSLADQLTSTASAGIGERESRSARVLAVVPDEQSLVTVDPIDVIECWHTGHGERCR
jgi:hypothetical protein